MRATILGLSCQLVDVYVIFVTCKWKCDWTYPVPCTLMVWYIVSAWNWLNGISMGTKDLIDNSILWFKQWSYGDNKCLLDSQVHVLGNDGMGSRAVYRLHSGIWGWALSRTAMSCATGTVSKPLLPCHSWPYYECFYFMKFLFYFFSFISYRNVSSQRFCVLSDKNTECGSKIWRYRIEPKEPKFLLTDWLK